MELNEFPRPEQRFGERTVVSRKERGKCETSCTRWQVVRTIILAKHFCSQPRWWWGEGHEGDDRNYFILVSTIKATVRIWEGHRSLLHFSLKRTVLAQPAWLSG